MESLNNKRFKIKNISSKKLSDLGFRHLPKSDNDNNYYTYKFSAYRNDEMTTLWGVITVCLEENYINTDVYNTDGTLYRPFYFVEYGNYDSLLQKINNNILNTYKKLGIVQVKQKRTNHEDND